jgi:hypothetical protein
MIIGVKVRSTLFRSPVIKERGKAKKSAETIPTDRLKKLVRTLKVKFGNMKHLNIVSMTVVRAGTFSGGRIPILAENSHKSRKEISGITQKAEPNLATAFCILHLSIKRM